MEPRDPVDPSAQGSVRLVTGSVRGLGLEIARGFRRAGDRVHVVWRSSEQAALALTDEFGDRIHRADLTSVDQACELVNRVVAMDGRLDTLVHGVGDYRATSMEDTSLDHLRHMLESNVASAHAVFDASRPRLRAARGSAVFLGCAGLDGLRARTRSAAYAAAKSALLVLVRSWAAEEALHGVRVNMVSPGIVPHPDAHADALAPNVERSIPAGRVGKPSEVSQAVRWLVSEEATYTTGADLPVSGGWMI